MRNAMGIILVFLLWQTSARSEEQTVRVTVFELADGRTIEALRVSSANVSGINRYAATTTAGEKVTFTADDIKSSTEKRIPAQGVAAAVRPPSPANAPTPAAPQKERQDPVEVTTFNLKSGRTVQAVDVSERDTAGRSNFELITVDGGVESLREENVLSKSVKLVDFETLPAEMQDEVASARAARKRNIYHAAQDVNEKTNALQRAQKNLSVGQNKCYEPAGTFSAGDQGEFHQYSIADQETLVRNIDIQIAFRQAQIDGCEAQMLSGNVPATAGAELVAGNPKPTGGMGKLQELTKNAAAEIARLKQKKADLQDSIKKYKEFIAKLTEDVEARAKDLEKAKAKLARAIKAKPELYPYRDTKPNASGPIRPPANDRDEADTGSDEPIGNRKRNSLDDE